MTDARDAMGVGQRAAFAITSAAHALGLPPAPPELPFNARLDAVLWAAMENPGAINPASYELAYRLRYAQETSV